MYRHIEKMHANIWIIYLRSTRCRILGELVLSCPVLFFFWVSSIPTLLVYSIPGVSLLAQVHLGRRRRCKTHWRWSGIRACFPPSLVPTESHLQGRVSWPFLSIPTCPAQLADKSRRKVVVGRKSQALFCSIGNGYLGSLPSGDL